MTYPWNAGEVLTAADLNSEFASKLPYSYGTATPSTSVDGFLWYDENYTPPTPKFWDGAAFQALTSGKILQIVRATDGVTRTTTSTSAVDVTGMSVTITPTKSDSAVIVLASFFAASQGGANPNSSYVLTDSSNNALSGAQIMQVGISGVTATLNQITVMIGYSTPATTSAVTYKLRFYSNAGTTTSYVANGNSTGQMYAIEVSA